MPEYKKYEPNHTAEYKQQCWDLAIGLQDVDGLKVSDELRYYSKQHIDGYMTLEEIQEKLYETYKPDFTDVNREKEANLVAANIVKILESDQAFTFSPITLKYIHRTLFKDIYKHAGEYRTYNFTKEEPILNGESVTYAHYEMIQDTFAYDFDEEKRKSYANVKKEIILKRVAKFTSDIWQVHAFCEGNTRTTALFMELYLRSIGFQVNNDLFKEHSKYFRNALVRANYANYSKGIDEDMSYLIKFYDNLLFEGQHILQNRDLYVRKLFPKKEESESEGWGTPPLPPI